MSEKEVLKYVYLFASTRSDKVMVHSVRRMELRGRLLAYKSESSRSDDVVSRWIRTVGEDSLRIIPMVATIGDSLAVRKVEQDFIGRYGCELNPIRAVESPEVTREKGLRYLRENPEKRRETQRAYRERNRKVIRWATVFTVRRIGKVLLAGLLRRLNVSVVEPFVREGCVGIGRALFTLGG